jgi:uncharacterized protein YbjT (DUF2867 family)
MYAIIGATGNTGHVVADQLLDAGLPVRVIGRSEDRLASFVERGAEPAVGDVSDADFVAQACDGAGGVYSLLPPLFHVDLRKWQGQVSRAIVAGIRAAGVPYVVNLSSVGAQHHEGTGPIVGLREHEDRLNELSETNVLHLRPAWFMENLYAMMEGVRAMGALATPIRDDVPIAFIATRDIGAEAAHRLAALDFDGHHTKELLGPREYTMPEVASILGEAIGEPDLPYVVAPEEAMSSALLAAGLHAATVETVLELYRGFNERLIVAREERTPANTTPTTLEEFAAEMAAAHTG